MLKDILKPKSESEILNDINHLFNPVDRFCYGFKFWYEKYNCDSKHIIPILKSLDNTAITYTVEQESLDDPLESYGTLGRIRASNKREIKIVVSINNHGENTFYGIELSRLIIIYMNNIFIDGKNSNGVVYIRR